MISKTMAKFQKVTAGFRLLNSEIGNDHRINWRGNLKKLGFRLLNSEIGKDLKNNGQVPKSDCRFSSP